MICYCVDLGEAKESSHLYPCTRDGGEERRRKAVIQRCWMDTGLVGGVGVD